MTNPDTPTPGLDEITSLPTIFKCMGRSYTATRSCNAVLILDITDITHPHLLGRAEPAGDGMWCLCTAKGLPVRRPYDVLDAVSALRETTWPPRDPRPAHDQP